MGITWDAFLVQKQDASERVISVCRSCAGYVTWSASSLHPYLPGHRDGPIIEGFRLLFYSYSENLRISHPWFEVLNILSYNDLHFVETEQTFLINVSPFCSVLKSKRLLVTVSQNIELCKVLLMFQVWNVIHANDMILNSDEWRSRYVQMTSVQINLKRLNELYMKLSNLYLPQLKHCQAMELEMRYCILYEGPKLLNEPACSNWGAHSSDWER
jgi:hypothetical protein